MVERNDYETCPDCGASTWYCDRDESWYHTDPKRTCFLNKGKTPTKKHRHPGIAEILEAEELLRTCSVGLWELTVDDPETATQASEAEARRHASPEILHVHTMIGTLSVLADICEALSQNRLTARQRATLQNLALLENSQ